MDAKKRKFSISISFLFFLVVLISEISGFDFEGKKSLIMLEDGHTRDFEKSALTLNRATRSIGDSDFELIAFKVESVIRYRYSRTYVTSHLRNSDRRNSHEAVFQVVLPETAFISKFAMEIDGRLYEAYVKEKEAAKREYKKAQSRGQSAGLLELNARHSNVFNVNVNVKANAVIYFNLTYEELLSRKFGHYEQIININGNEISKTNDVEIIVSIEESQALRDVKALNLQNELEAPEINTSDNPDAHIEKIGSNRARIVWSPHSKFERLQRFIVQYDINRELDSGEVLVMNGYFVHFFAPRNLKPLKKHMVFVLDVSGSMSGRKIEQLRDAMLKILSDLKSEDYFNMVIFSTSVDHWKPGDVYRGDWNRPFGSQPVDEYPKSEFKPYRANSENIKSARSYISTLIAAGSTNINDALIEALTVTAQVKSKDDDGGRWKRATRQKKIPGQTLPSDVKTLILFLTDGMPTSGVTQHDQIMRNVQLANLGLSTPIFTLGLGNDVDITFLRKISLQNHGFARKIYEAADVVLQLQGFYAEISSPLLANVEFDYTPPEKQPYKIHDVTEPKFPRFFNGWELAVAGKMSPRDDMHDDSHSDVSVSIRVHSDQHVEPLIKYVPTDRCYFYSNVKGYGHDGLRQWGRPLVYSIRPPWWCHWPPYPTTTTTQRPPPSAEDDFLERLWAYLTIQNLIDRDLAGGMEDGELPKNRAMRLALKYGFVTSLTSLVVVKPEITDIAWAESADTNTWARDSMGGTGSSGGHHPTMFFMNGGGKGRIGPMAPNGGIGGGASGADIDVEEAFGGDSGTSKSTTKSGGKTKADTGPKDRKDKNGKTPKPQTKPAKDNYELDDIKWLKGSSITIENSGEGDQEYKVARSSSEMRSTKSAEICTISGKSSSPLSKTTGRCQHLKECIKYEFLNDFQLYKDSHFCEIKMKGGKTLFAGSCCEN